MIMGEDGLPIFIAIIISAAILGVFVVAAAILVSLLLM